MIKNGNFSHWLGDDFDEEQEVCPRWVGDYNDEKGSARTHVRWLMIMIKDSKYSRLVDDSNDEKHEILTTIYKELTMRW